MRAIPEPAAISCLFLDIGGVLLTDGWNRDARSAAEVSFGLEPLEIEERHHQAWDSHQMGQITLDDYLDWVIFHRQRPFTKAQFRQFMFDQSKPHGDMLALMIELKRLHGLKIAAVSNEGRELNAHRIRRFKLDRLVDCFISSCFVHLLKPAPEIFELALDIAQVPPQQVVYIENTAMFVEIAEGLGIRSILHTECGTTRTKLAAMGLSQIKGSPA